jgi:hypothetical protein
MTPQEFKAALEKVNNIWQWNGIDILVSGSVVADSTGWQIIACSSYDGGYDNGPKLTSGKRGWQVVSVFVADNTGRWNIFGPRRFLAKLRDSDWLK